MRRMRLRNVIAVIFGAVLCLGAAGTALAADEARPAAAAAVAEVVQQVRRHGDLNLIRLCKDPAVYRPGGGFGTEFGLTADTPHPYDIVTGTSDLPSHDGNYVLQQGEEL